MEEKKNIGKLLLGEWNTKTIVAVAVGAALFGVLMCYGGIPVFTNTSLTTAMLVPVIVGGLFGPLPAFVAAGVGNVISFGVITPIFTVIFYGGDLEVTFIQAFAATLGNFAVLVVVGIPVLKVLANRYKSRSNLAQEHSDNY